MSYEPSVVRDLTLPHAPSIPWFDSLSITYSHNSQSASSFSFPLVVWDRSAVQRHVSVVRGVHTLPRMEPVVLAESSFLLHLGCSMFCLARFFKIISTGLGGSSCVSRFYGLHWTRGAHYKRTSFFRLSLFHNRLILTPFHMSIPSSEILLSLINNRLI